MGNRVILFAASNDTLTNVDRFIRWYRACLTDKDKSRAVYLPGSGQPNFPVLYHLFHPISAVAFVTKIKKKKKIRGKTNFVYKTSAYQALGLWLIFKYIFKYVNG